MDKLIFQRVPTVWKMLIAKWRKTFCILQKLSFRSSLSRVAGALLKLLPTSRLPIKIAADHCTAADCAVFIFDLYNWLPKDIHREAPFIVLNPIQILSCRPSDCHRSPAHDCPEIFVTQILVDAMLQFQFLRKLAAVVSCFSVIETLSLSHAALSEFGRQDAFSARWFFINITLLILKKEPTSQAGDTTYAGKAVCCWQRLKGHITNDAYKGLHPVADCKQTIFPYSFCSVHALTSASRMLSQYKPLAKPF